jgi:hypothetical protein
MTTIRRLAPAALLAAAAGLSFPAPAGAQAGCDQMMAAYDGSPYWAKAFEPCMRTSGGPTNRAAIFECAWVQVPLQDRSECLKARLLATEHMRQEIDKVAAHNGPAFNCDKVLRQYDNPQWWQFVLAPCMFANVGMTDRTILFNCGFNQVAPVEKALCDTPAALPPGTPLLQRRLAASEHARKAIDRVAAYNGAPGNRDQLVVKYDGSAWWDGAFDNCIKNEGTTNRDAIFECAWGQVPGADSHQWLKARLAPTEQTRRGIDRVAAANGSIAGNHVTVRFPNCLDPRTGCPESCDLPANGSVPDGYFLPPPSMVDTPGSSFGIPPGHNIGAHEGRLRADLRAIARARDPLGCSLRLAAAEYATGNNLTAQAYADLSVTGRRAFEQFRFEAPKAAYCDTILPRRGMRPLNPACPAPAAPPSEAALREGCLRALDRAYDVANFLRTGQLLQANPKKKRDRDALGWIAVSGEDDQPHRPVNVPSSDYPQYDIKVGVPAPRAVPPNPAFFEVATRFVVAEGSPVPVAAVTPAPRFTLRPEPEFKVRADARILLFIHGMDSRAEEATVLTRELISPGSSTTVIAVDLPTSGYAENLDYDRVSPLIDIGLQKVTVLPVPVTVPAQLASLVLPLLGGVPGLPTVVPPLTPLPDFWATGQTPVLDFLEAFVVRFVETLDGRVPLKNNIRAVMGGSLGGNLAFRLGRRYDLTWLPAVVSWSPASIWESLGEGADITKHMAVWEAWGRANDRNPDDPNDLNPFRIGRRAHFFGSWDVATLPLLVPAQSQTWMSDYWPCKQAALVGARLDRHETYDARFLSWHWRLGAEQFLYSHQTFDPLVGGRRHAANRKPMLLACGLEDRVLWNDICGATLNTVPFLTRTAGKALFLDKTGHDLSNERPRYWARQVKDFLGP